VAHCEGQPFDVKRPRTVWSRWEIHPACNSMMGLGKSLTGSIPLWEVTHRYQGIFPHRSLYRGRMRFGRTRVGRSAARPCGPSLATLALPPRSALKLLTFPPEIGPVGT
jgi:hypothetical protein